tara:strand:+ start:1929 stop:2996 length:1068 start_codon:yes stop_codon:yes gene_type:complete
MPKRFLGNIMTDAPTAPDGNYISSAASGVWSLAEALSYTKGGLWPNAANAAPAGLFGGFGYGNYQVDHLSFGGSLGNATDFGDYSINSRYLGGFSSSTRSVSFGGWIGSSFNYTNTMLYTTFGTTGSFSDFGDMTPTYGRVLPSGLSSSTRGVSCMGATGEASDDGFVKTNIFDYVTIASTGNATDFGDATFVGYNTGALSSPTRGVIGGGSSSNDADTKNIIQYITIASTGNAQDFGDLTASKNALAGASNAVRGLFMGGGDGGDENVIEYITIASTGNATDFGDTIGIATSGQAVASLIRAVCPYYSDSSSTYDQLNYVDIASTGNALDFGDLATATNDGQGFATSNAHGGLA